ncbi:hypothetical protein BCR32DRAFT_273361 [Anaeromyces robustus]|uniref:EF-hand domain-containing protein n=1 Tax=Anaeromyces robustus TaxID=1754192 RepID=A0A1Y1VRP1_9FUNG|nr:hypothetical protein BCR32DRAFT_273361 [Anaeromyces robustus]|eukprot:ORX63696.1 hypothetical protein BCR32DRAFT_273361 [Anaeromyces robustus]
MSEENNSTNEVQGTQNDSITSLSNNNQNKETYDSNKENHNITNDSNINNDDNNNDNNDDNEELNTILNDETPRNTNSPVTSDIYNSDLLNRETSDANMKEKELSLFKRKKKLQERNDQNKIRKITEEEIDLAFKWFTGENLIITPDDVRDRFDTFFTQVSKNDKKYYVVGGIKQDTRHLVNTKEEQSQSEMFNSKQTKSSLKKMLLKYPFKIKDYDNALSILCGGDLEETMPLEIIDKYIDIFKENEVNVKNDIKRVLKCFDKDKDGQLGISDILKMRLSDLKKITDDYI